MLRQLADRVVLKQWRRYLVAISALAGLFTENVRGGTTDVAPGRPRQEFVAPAPGSYTLQVIQKAPGGNVLDIDGRAYKFNRYTTGRVTLLSFIYTYCVDPIGCQLAFDVFTSVRERLLATPDLAQQVRFVSLSFDPVNDTPMAMKHYAGKLSDAGSPLRWHFLTTRSVAELKPIIDDFGQDVSVQLDDKGRPTRLYNHTLKIFLLDTRGSVREIYTTAFLLPDVLFNDIQTLVMEHQGDR
jgi:cytochrome oxidase Cu insertion factor (SCO1/SenC/PrrC family)